MTKLTNNSKMTGPYPGRTWEQEAAMKPDAIFGFVVFPKTEDDICDHCLGSCAPEFSCCSKKCYNARKRESKLDGEAEARAS